MKRLFRFPFFCLWGILFSLSSQAQLPVSRAYLFQFRALNDSLYLFSQPEYLTAFNPDGYNNQPFFVSEDELLLTVMIPDSAEAQTDIYSFHLQDRRMTRLTATLESEYSPQIIPETNAFSTVRVAYGDASLQYFWRYDLAGGQYGRMVMQDLTDLGYYFWLGPVQFLAFRVEEPPILEVINLQDGRRKKLAENVGRSFARLPEGDLAFVQKEQSGWYIRNMDTYFFVIKPAPLVQTLPGSEDFVVLSDGTILMGKGSKLYKFKPGQDSDWKEIADFSHYGIKQITRLAVNGKGKLALIDRKGG